ncbi:MAG: PilZ domain-containing protein [Desulfobacteraceae bacterium]|nr:PilZ domain-containing protein [Desulfobacteraceae bacterium]
MATKALVNSENTVSVSCPSCKKGRDIDVSRFKGCRDAKIKCPCGNTWRVRVEYRRGYRKKTNLQGSYKLIPKDKKTGGAGPMTVVDLSHKGLRMKIKEFPFTLDVGDRLNIKFTLDDSNISIVNREVVVKNMHPPYVGAVFHHPPVEDNILGFYLLP